MNALSAGPEAEGVVAEVKRHCAARVFGSVLLFLNLPS